MDVQVGLFGLPVTLGITQPGEHHQVSPLEKIAYHFFMKGKSFECVVIYGLFQV